MPPPDSDRRGLRLLAERVRVAADYVAAVPARFDRLISATGSLPRCLVTTGLGTSEGHARHLAEVAWRFADQPARYVSTAAIGATPTLADPMDWLVVFSQGLSANARHALTTPERWGRVILVTGLAGDALERELQDEEKRVWLETLEERGVTRLDLGCGVEYGSLVRVIGARAGYAIAWSLVRTLAARRLTKRGALDCEPARIRAAQLEAPDEAGRIFASDAALARFFDPKRTLLIVSDGGVLEMADQLSLKLAEGMLRPRPLAIDVLEFAHGPLQGLADRDASILYLSARDPTPASRDWQARFAATLDSERHDLRFVRAALPWPFAALEYEAIFDSFVLRALAASENDLVAWPGAEREAALYDVGPAPPRRRQRAASMLRRTPAYETAVWPEVEAWLAAGRTTALVGLGSIEQHGPHLPLGTDRWIADALLAGLADRLAEAVALPAIAIGCASEHLDFSGTLHIEPGTLERILRDLLGSLARHGFERAFVFTAHGGNVDALGDMRDRLTRAVRPLELRIEIDLRVGQMQAAAVAAERLPTLSAGPHAGEYETSLVAGLEPGRVRVDALRADVGRVARPGEAQALFYPSLRPHTESGVLGDPSQASAERAARYLDAWLDLLEAAYREAFPSGREKNRKYAKGTQNA